MSNSMNIQYLETAGEDEFGASVAVGLSSPDRRIVQVFIAAATVVVGDVVSIDAAQTADGDKAIKIKPADTGDTDLVCPVGIVLESRETDGALTAGSTIAVVVRGVCEANVLAHTKGDVLTITATAGSLDTTAAATSPVVAISLDGAGAPGVATVYVRGSF